MSRSLSIPRGLTLTPLGACGSVVPSGYFLHDDRSGLRALVDCGDAPDDRALGALPCRPADLDVVIVTHGHLDHIGGLPMLVRAGFTGPIVTTAPTRDLARHSLHDSARHEAKRVSPRFTDGDVTQTLRQMQAIDARVGGACEPVPGGRGLRALFQPNGHIIGSCQVTLEWDGVDGPQRVLFSGDLGPGSSGLRAPCAPPLDVDVAVVEATYGDRTRHVRTADHRRRLLADALEEGFARGGPIVIPTFAIGRLQDLLLDLHILQYQRPRFFDGVDVSVVKGLGTRVSGVYADVLTGNDASLWLGSDVVDAFLTPQASVMSTILRNALTTDPAREELPPSHAHHRRVWSEVRLSEVKLKTKTIVLVGGGMGAGPAEELFRRMATMKHATVLFVGYCAPDTLGGRLQAGHRRVRFHDGEYRRVQFTTRRLEGYSAHADREGLVAWAVSRHPARASVAPVARLFLVTHGEDRSRRVLAGAIQEAAGHAGHNVEVMLPTEGRAIPLEAGIFARA